MTGMATSGALGPSDGTPMIVSSNRFNDIAPYMGRIYALELDRYGSIFPWEYPQNATQEQEQIFLRDWFGDREIHVWGGEPDGFRFLKQVWMCCALWNLEHKVPAMVDWWLGQADNQALLQDPGMREHILSADAKPSAFFPGQELKECGDKCKRQAIDFIQQHIRFWDAQRETEKEGVDPSDSPSVDSTVDSTVDSAANATVVVDSTEPVSLPSESTSESAAQQPEQDQKLEINSPKPAPEIQAPASEASRFSETQRTASQPTGTGHDIKPADTVEDVQHPPPQQLHLQQVHPQQAYPQQAYQQQGHPQQSHPPQGLPQQGHPQQGHPQQGYPQQGYPQQGYQQGHHQQGHPQRGFSGSGRGNARFDQRPHFQQQPYFDRNQQVQSQRVFNVPYSSYHGVPAQYLGHDQMRPPSGASMAPAHPSQQMYLDQSLPPTQFSTGAPPQYHPGAAQFMMNQQVPAGQPIYIADSQMQQAYYPAQMPFGDRTNQVYENRNVSNLSSSFAGNEAYGKRGGRRDSNTSRGGRTRGHTGGRGRGKNAHGKNESSAENRDMPNFAGQQMGRNMSNEYGAPPGMVMHGQMDRHASMSSNWRNKEQLAQLPPLDTNMPARNYSSPPGLPSKPVAPNPLGAFQGHAQQPFRNFTDNLPPDPGFMPLHDVATDEARKNRALVLTKEHIGSACTYVNKLVLFDPSKMIAEQAIREHFSKFSTLLYVNKSKQATVGSYDMWWLTFVTNLDAQKALDHGSRTWSGNVISVEVPKQFWDPQHKGYPGFDKGNTLQASASVPMQPMPSQSQSTKDTVEPGIAEQENRSGESTPTPKSSAARENHKLLLSGDTTPTASTANSPIKVAKRDKATSNQETKAQDDQMPDQAAKTSESAQTGSKSTESKAPDTSLVEAPPVDASAASTTGQTDDKRASGDGDASICLLYTSPSPRD